MDNVLYIINPAGNGGAGKKAWEAFKSSWVDPIDSAHVVYTEYPGHAREIAAVSKGYQIIAAVGGDGTVGEVISGIMARLEPKPRLAIIPCGTGNDVARNAGIFSITDAVASLRGGKSRAFDLVRADRQVDGRNEHRYAFLFGNAGFSSIPMMKPWMKRCLGAKGAYYLAALLQVFAYRTPHMTVRVDEREYVGKTYLVVAGNSEWVAGNSMRLSPGAIADDGELNIAIIPSASIFKVVTKLFPHMAKGTHIDDPGILYFTGRKIEVQSEPAAVLDLDGELFGTTPATFSICPLALKILCATQPPLNNNSHFR